jgi:hypothetical protein
MPGLAPGIQVFWGAETNDMDGRDEPGHDSWMKPRNSPLIMRCAFSLRLAGGSGPQ